MKNEYVKWGGDELYSYPNQIGAIPGWKRSRHERIHQGIGSDS